MDAREAFRALAEKFHLFLIYPQKTMAERKDNIDAEIRARVTAAGGWSMAWTSARRCSGTTATTSIST